MTEGKIQSMSCHQVSEHFDNKVERYYVHNYPLELIKCSAEIILGASCCPMMNKCDSVVTKLKVVSYLDLIACQSSLAPVFYSENKEVNLDSSSLFHE